MEYSPTGISSVASIGVESMQYCSSWETSTLVFDQGASPVQRYRPSISLGATFVENGAIAAGKFGLWTHHLYSAPGRIGTVTRVDVVAMHR